MRPENFSRLEWYWLRHWWGFRYTWFSRESWSEWWAYWPNQFMVWLSFSALLMGIGAAGLVFIILS